MSREQETETNSRINRRRVLQALGVGTGVTVAANSAAATSKRLVVKQPDGCTGIVDYEVCVTGTVDKHENADDLDEITNDGTCATGGMGPTNGNDIFTYTGEIESVDVSGPAAVYADGELIHAPDCLERDGGGQDGDTGDSGSGGDSFCPLDNSISIGRESRSEAVEYDIAVTGVIELQSGRRVEQHSGELSAHGHARNGISFDYSGELTRIQITGPASVSIDQPNPCKP